VVLGALAAGSGREPALTRPLEGRLSGRERIGLALGVGLALAADLVFFLSGNTAFHAGVFSGGWTMIAAPHAGTRVKTEWIWSSNVRFGRVR